MNAFLEAAFAFPTVIFSVLVGLFLLYGLLALAGAADVEWLDGLAGGESGGLFSGLSDALGISGVPVAIFGGISAILGWVTSFLLMQAFGGSGVAAGALTFVLAGGGGILGAALLTRPLRHLFRTAGGPSRRAYVGKICTIRSLTVDADSGRAEIEDGGAGLVVEVRCFRENRLKPGSPALVYDIDQVRGIYHVAPIDPSIAEVNPELIARRGEPELSSTESSLPRATQ